MVEERRKTDTDRPVVVARATLDTHIRASASSSGHGTQTSVRVAVVGEADLGVDGLCVYSFSGTALVHGVARVVEDRVGGRRDQVGTEGRLTVRAGRRDSLWGWNHTRTNWTPNWGCWCR